MGLFIQCINYKLFKNIKEVYYITNIIAPSYLLYLHSNATINFLKYSYGAKEEYR